MKEKSSGRIGREGAEGFSASHQTKTQIKKAIDITYSKESKDREKKDRSTVDGVFDRITLRNLNKLLAKKMFLPLIDVIFTGKEAKVFYTKTVDLKTEIVIKIYKTMVLTFKNRLEYLEGDYRFARQSKLSRANPHKIINLWALKEFRNLRRMKEAGIRVPAPMDLLNNILVMEFIGQNAVAAPRLIDAKFSAEGFSDAYVQLVKIVRQMFVECKLVHADLSPYNILVNNGELVIIDVSQALDFNHDKAIEYLKRDLFNLNAFFSKQKVAVFSLAMLFNFVTDQTLKGQDIERSLEMMVEDVKEKSIEALKHEDDLFMGTNIPRTLFDIEIEEVEKMIYGNEKGTGASQQYFSALTGLKGMLEEVGIKPDEDEDDEGEEEDEEGSKKDEDERDEEGNIRDEDENEDEVDEEEKEIRMDKIDKKEEEEEESDDEHVEMEKIEEEAEEDDNVKHPEQHDQPKEDQVLNPDAESEDLPRAPRGKKGAKGRIQISEVILGTRKLDELLSTPQPLNGSTGQPLNPEIDSKFKQKKPEKSRISGVDDGKSINLSDETPEQKRERKRRVKEHNQARRKVKAEIRNSGQFPPQKSH